MSFRSALTLRRCEQSYIEIELHALRLLALQIYVLWVDFCKRMICDSLTLWASLSKAKAILSRMHLSADKAHQNRGTPNFYLHVIYGKSEGVSHNLGHCDCNHEGHNHLEGGRSFHGQNCDTNQHSRHTSEHWCSPYYLQKTDKVAGLKATFQMSLWRSR